MKKEASDKKTKAAKEKSEATKKVEQNEKDKQIQNQKARFEQQRAIFDRLIEEDDAFWTELETSIRDNNMMMNHYDFQKDIFENMQKPMIAGVIMGIATKLRAKDFEV